MNLAGMLGGAIGSVVEEVLIAFRADTSDADAKFASLDAKLAKSEATQKAAFDAAQAQNQKAIEAERELASVDEQITAVRTELSQKRVASSVAEFDAIMRTRDALRQDLTALTEYRTSVVAAVDQEVKLAAALQTTSMELAKKTAAAREAAAAGSGAGGAGVLGTAIGVGAGMVAFNAVMALDQAIKNSITSWVDYGHAVEHASLLMGTSTENASKLVYAFQFFGLSVSDADRTIAQLTRHIADNQKQFEALGIQTRQANGELVDSYTVFNQLREVMSKGGDGATKLALQLQLASRGGSAAGQSMAELNMILGMSDAEWQAFSDQAEQAGVVMDSKTAKGAFDLYTQMQTVNAEQRTLAFALSQDLMPVLATLTRWALTAMVAVQQMGAAIAEVVGGAAFGALVGGLAGGIPGAIVGAAIGGIGGGLVAAGSGAHISTAEEIQAQVDKMMQTANNLLKLQDGTQNNSGGLNSNLADQKRAETQAIQDEIKAIEDLARAREQDMRTALTAYEREQQAAIEALNTAQKARDDAHRADIEQIQATQRAADDAFKADQEARAQQIADLRTAVQLQEQALSLWDQQYQLERDKKKLASDSNEPVGISAGESLLDYYKRVSDQEQKLADDQHKVTLDQKRLELDQFKAATDEQIRAIEAIGKTEQDVYDARKRAAEQRVRDIQLEQRTEQERSQAAIKGIQDEITKERDKTNAAIQHLQDVTRVQVEELQKQVRALSGAASAIGGMAPTWATPWSKWGKPPVYTPPAYTPPAGTVGPPSTTSGGAGPGFKGIPSGIDPGNTAAPGSAPATIDDVYAHYTDLFGHQPDIATARDILSAGLTYAELQNRDKVWMGNSADNPGTHTITVGGGGGGDVLTHATGGSMMLTRPTALVDMLSGRTFATAAEQGAEPVTFGDRARAGGGPGSGGSLTVKVMLPDGRVLASAVLPHIAEHLDAAASSGYSRRT